MWPIRVILNIGIRPNFVWSQLVFQGYTKTLIRRFNFYWMDAGRAGRRKGHTDVQNAPQQYRNQHFDAQTGLDTGKVRKNQRDEFKKIIPQRPGRGGSDRHEIPMLYERLPAAPARRNLVPPLRLGNDSSNVLVVSLLLRMAIHPIKAPHANRNHPTRSPARSRRPPGPGRLVAPATAGLQPGTGALLHAAAPCSASASNAGITTPSSPRSASSPPRSPTWATPAISSSTRWTSPPAICTKRGW